MIQHKIVFTFLSLTLFGFCASRFYVSSCSPCISPLRFCRTTNHLERLDPALSRPGRMDVWIEFKNASKWQAELLFRNFFPSTDEDDEIIEGDLEGIELPSPPASPTTTQSSSFFSMSGLSSSLRLSPSASTTSLSSTSASGSGLGPTAQESTLSPRMRTSIHDALKNQAYLPPPIEDDIAVAKHSAKPLDSATLARLAKSFADSIPDEEFSVAALQGCECHWFTSQLILSFFSLFPPSIVNPFPHWLFTVIVCESHRAVGYVCWGIWDIMLTMRFLSFLPL